MDKKYKLKIGIAYFFNLIGAIAVLTIILSPLGILMFIISLKGKITLKDDELEYWWVGTKKFKFDEIESFKVAKGGGLIYVMIQPFDFKLKSGKNMRVPIGAFKNNEEIKSYIKDKTGLTL